MDVEMKQFTAEESPKEQPHGKVNTVAFSLDGHFLAIGDSTGTVFIYKAPSLKLDMTLFPDTDTSGLRAIREIAFSNEALAVGAESGIITLYCKQSGSWRELARQEEGKPIYSVCFSSDGEWFAAGAKSPSPIFYRVAAWARERRCKMQLGSAIHSVRASPTFRDVFVAGDDTGIITVIDVSTLHRVATLPRQAKSPVLCMEFSLNGEELLSSHEGGVLTVWNTQMWVKKSQIHQQEGDVLSISFSPTGKFFIAAGDFDNQAGLIVCSAGPEGDYSGGISHLHLRGICISFSPDCMGLAVGGAAENVGGGQVRVLSESWYMALQKDSIEVLVDLAKHHGSAEAMYSLGIIYAQGKVHKKEIKRNDVEAALWFRRAASEGFVGGGRQQDELSKFYKFGEDRFPDLHLSNRPAFVWNQVADLDLLDGRDLSHLYRDWNLLCGETVTSMSQRSVSFGDLLEVSRRHRIKREMTTRNVVKRIVIPYTSDKNISYAEYLCEEAGKPCGMPDIYMIHAWDMTFEDLMIAASYAARGGQQNSWAGSSLDSNSYTEEELGLRLWICAFCVNQHKDDRMPLGHPGRETDKFDKVLEIFQQQGKKAVFTLDNFNTALYRTWCLSELHLCRSLGMTVLYYGNCCLAPPNRKDFKSVLESEAGCESEKERILRKIKGQVTIDKFDEHVFRMVSEGIFAELKRVEQFTLDQQQVSQNRMEQVLRDEMKKVTNDTNQVHEEDLRVRDSFVQEIQTVHHDVDEMHRELRQAQAAILEMKEIITSQAIVIEQQRVALEKHQQTTAASESVETEMRTEIRELCSEMSEVRPNVEAAHEELEAHRRVSAHHQVVSELQSSQMRASMEEVRSELSELSTIKQRLQSALTEVQEENKEEMRFAKDLESNFTSEMEEHKAKIDALRNPDKLSAASPSREYAIASPPKIPSPSPSGNSKNGLEFKGLAAPKVKKTLRQSVHMGAVALPSAIALPSMFSMGRGKNPRAVPKPLASNANAVAMRNRLLSDGGEEVDLEDNVSENSPPSPLPGSANSQSRGSAAWAETSSMPATLSTDSAAFFPVGSSPY